MVCILSANRHKKEVEPMEIEPLTSAVQRRIDSFADVRGRSENRRFSRFSVMIDCPCSWAFAQVGVKIGVID